MESHWAELVVGSKKILLKVHVLAAALEAAAEEDSVQKLAWGRLALQVAMEELQNCSLAFCQCGSEVHLDHLEDPAVEQRSAYTAERPVEAPAVAPVEPEAMVMR